MPAKRSWWLGGLTLSGIAGAQAVLYLVSGFLPEVAKTALAAAVVVVGVLAVRLAIRLVSERERHRVALDDKTYRDPLTGLANRAKLIRELTAATVARRGGVLLLLDLPCGDFGWLSRADLTGIAYTGGDIVPDLVAQNSRRYRGPGRRFRYLNLSRDPLPRADVVLCRDGLVHLGYPQIFRAFANLRRSGSTYLLATTFLELDANTEIDTGDWRPLNLCLPPFALPKPLAVIVEQWTAGDGAYADKALGLWRVADLPELPRTTPELPRTTS